MSILYFLILFLFIITIVRDSLFFMWLWQIKEYRTDRMISHLKNDQSMNSIGIIYLYAIIIFFLLLGFPKYSFMLSLVTAIFFTVTSVRTMEEIKNRSLRRPRPTVKIILIILGTISLIIPIVYLFIRSGEIPRIELFLLIFTILPSIISISVFVVNPIFELKKKNILEKATEKMRSFKKVKTIGITGSYGKTSTKEFLYAILSQKFRVVKTEGNNNTNIGVAYTILRNVTDDYDYFICEMGAYKIGEIKEMCGIAMPEIGILTGVNEQHFELFGSIKNTHKAKFELIEALPENGIAVINSKLKMKSEKFKPKVKNISYFSLDMADGVKVYRDYSEFIYKSHNFRLNLLGKHYIENLISAIMVSESLGMELDEIEKAVSKIKPGNYMIKRSAGINDSVFIDDSYSANPDGVMAALDYISEAYADHKKIIVFPGFIELGKKSKGAHEKLFKRISEICDFAYILNAKRSIPDSNKCEFIFESDFDKAATMLQNNLDKNTVVLFESRGSGVVMKKLNANNEKIK